MNETNPLSFKSRKDVMNFVKLGLVVRPFTGLSELGQKDNSMPEACGLPAPSFRKET